MSNDLIWSYFLQLSEHMCGNELNAEDSEFAKWYDLTNEGGAWYYPRNAYKESDIADLATFDELVKYAASLKYNMLVIDICNGIQFEAHPEISTPDAWSKDFMKKKLAEIRALGLEPIPKLNFSSGHDVWLMQYRYMKTRPEYYQVVSDCIREVCELFDYPRFLHLGMDEEQFSNASRDQAVWWHDAYFMFAECEKHGVRPWVWSDAYWHHPDNFLKLMPKSVLQSNWFYDNMREYPKTEQNYNALRAYEVLEKHGYDQIPGFTTWAVNYNAYQTLAHGKEIISPEHLKGYLTIPWVHTRPDEKYRLMNDAYRLYCARKKIYPETL